MNKTNLMDIEQITIAQARSLVALFQNPSTGIASHPFEVGQNYFIRTVTHHYTGKLEVVFPGELVLSTAAWIADDGRFYQAVTKGEFAEVEPYGADQRVIVGRSGILDAVKINNLPTSQK